MKFFLIVCCNTPNPNQQAIYVPNTSLLNIPVCVCVCVCVCARLPTRILRKKYWECHADYKMYVD